MGVGTWKMLWKMTVSAECLGGQRGCPSDEDTVKRRKFGNKPSWASVRTRDQFWIEDGGGLESGVSRSLLTPVPAHTQTYRALPGTTAGILPAVSLGKRMLWE